MSAATDPCREARANLVFMMKEETGLSWVCSGQDDNMDR